MDQSDQAMPLIDRPGDGAFQWIQHDAEQLDKHPPGSALFGSAANDRTGLAIRC